MATFLQFQAPHPDYESIIFMPTPSFGDRERPESRIQLKKAMDGESYSHITQRQVFTAMHYAWSFNITRLKALELKAFIDAHIGQPWRLIWPGRDNIIAHLLVNPLQLDMAFRAVVAGSVEAVPIDLEFESVQ